MNGEETRRSIRCGGFVESAYYSFDGTKKGNKETGSRLRNANICCCNGESIVGADEIKSKILEDESHHLSMNVVLT